MQVIRVSGDMTVDENNVQLDIVAPSNLVFNWLQGGEVTVNNTTTTDCTITANRPINGAETFTVVAGTAVTFFYDNRYYTKADSVQSANNKSQLADIAIKSYRSTSYNLFDINEQTELNIIDNSYIDASGVIGATPNYYISKPIPITPNKNYLLLWKSFTQSQSLYGGWFDTNDEWISNIVYTGTKITAPQNATICKLNIYKVADDYGFNGIFKELATDEQIPVKYENIICLGDSITQGVLVDEGEVYVDIMKKILNTDNILNYGLSGSNIAKDDTEGIETFVTRAKKMDVNIDVVIIFGGVNDWLDSATAPFGTMSDRNINTFYGQLHELLLGIQRKYGNSKVFFCTPLHTLNEDIANTFTGKTLEEYVDAIKEVCNYYAIKIIDLFNESSIQPNNPILKSITSVDGIHPNAIGHTIIANTIARYIMT